MNRLSDEAGREEKPDLVRNRLDRIHWGLGYTIICVDSEEWVDGHLFKREGSLTHLLYGL